MNKVKRFTETEWEVFQGAANFGDGSEPFVAYHEVENAVDAEHVDYDAAGYVVIGDQASVQVVMADGDTWMLPALEGSMPEAAELIVGFLANVPAGKLESVLSSLNFTLL